MRDKPAIFGFLLYALILLAPAQNALAAVPVGIALELQQAASDIHRLLQNEAALAGSLADPETAAILLRRANGRAGDAMSAAVVGAVARYPAHNAEIVALAGAVAPRFSAQVALAVARAFPGFATGYQAPPILTYPTLTYAAAIPQPTFGYGTVAPVPGQIEAPVDDAFMDDGFGDFGEANEIYDPWETINRGVFWFNDQIDSFLIKPIAQVYGFVTPDAAKQAIARGFDNLGAPARFANDLLQGEFGDAGATGARFLINSSIGIAGLFDIAADWGHPAHPSDFGQTLAAYGVGAGPYLIVPILGPTTLRDGFGGIVDTAFDPFGYMFDTIPVNLAVGGAGGIVLREAFIEPLDDLRANSIDYYSSLRGAFYQNRDGELRRGAAAESALYDDAFAAFE